MDTKAAKAGKSSPRVRIAKITCDIESDYKNPDKRLIVRIIFMIRVLRQ